MQRIAILSNDVLLPDAAIRYAVSRAGMEPVHVLWSASINTLAACQGMLILDAADHPAMIQVLHDQSALGKPILGFEQGAAVLCKSGLVPGLEDAKPAMTMIADSHVSDQAAIQLSEFYQRNAFTQHLTIKQTIPLLVSETRYRFVIPPALMDEMVVQGLNLFQYVGSSECAAVSNKAGNVLAMAGMVDFPLGGDALLHAMRDAIASGRVEKVYPLHYYPRR